MKISSRSGLVCIAHGFRSGGCNSFGSDVVPLLTFLDGFRAFVAQFGFGFLVLYVIAECYNLDNGRILGHPFADIVQLAKRSSLMKELNSSKWISTEMIPFCWAGSITMMFFPAFTF